MATNKNETESMVPSNLDSKFSLCDACVLKLDDASTRQSGCTKPGCPKPAPPPIHSPCPAPPRLVKTGCPVLCSHTHPSPSPSCSSQNERKSSTCLVDRRSSNCLIARRSSTCMAARVSRCSNNEKGVNENNNNDEDEVPEEKDVCCDSTCGIEEGCSDSQCTPPDVNGNNVDTDSRCCSATGDQNLKCPVEGSDGDVAAKARASSDEEMKTCKNILLCKSSTHHPRCRRRMTGDEDVNEICCSDRIILSFLDNGGENDENVNAEITGKPKPSSTGTADRSEDRSSDRSSSSTGSAAVIAVSLDGAYANQTRSRSAEGNHDRQGNNKEGDQCPPVPDRLINEEERCPSPKAEESKCPPPSKCPEPSKCPSPSPEPEKEKCPQTSPPPQEEPKCPPPSKCPQPEVKEEKCPPPSPKCASPEVEEVSEKCSEKSPPTCYDPTLIIPKCPNEEKKTEVSEKCPSPPTCSEPKLVIEIDEKCPNEEKKMEVEKVSCCGVYVPKEKEELAPGACPQLEPYCAPEEKTLLEKVLDPTPIRCCSYGTIPYDACKAEQFFEKELPSRKRCPRKVLGVDDKSKPQKNPFAEWFGRKDPCPHKPAEPFSPSCATPRGCTPPCVARKPYPCTDETCVSANNNTPDDDGDFFNVEHNAPNDDDVFNDDYNAPDDDDGWIKIE